MTDDLDAVIDAVAAIEDASGRPPTSSARRQSWADLSKFKQATTPTCPWSVPGPRHPRRTLLSVPVLVSNSMTDGTMLVLDKRTDPERLRQRHAGDPDGVLLRFRFVGVRATWRFGQKIANPDRVIKLTVAAPEPADDLGAGVFELLTGAQGGPGLCSFRPGHTWRCR